jgi:hypothetical protein
VWLSLRGEGAFEGSERQTADAWTKLLPVGAVWVLVVLTIFATAQGDLRLGESNRRIVSWSLFDIWTKTRDLTPEDALLFTDQTGDDRNRLSGWNDYSLMAQRQFYISSWPSSRLRYDLSARRARLARNDAVLEGALLPKDLPLSRGYSGYYAVLVVDRKVPPSFESIYSNEAYTLFRIGERREK